MNIASREAAVAPTLIDSLAEYAGAYNTVFLAGPEGQAPRPLELTIAPGKSGAVPTFWLQLLLTMHPFLHACFLWLCPILSCK